MDDRSTGTKSRERRAFVHYLRTGQRLVEEPDSSEGLKFNPWHDPRNGQFTFAPGGPKRSSRSGHVLRSASQKPHASNIAVHSPETIHPPRLEAAPRENSVPKERNRGSHIIVPIEAGVGTYEEFVAAEIQAGATRIWPLAGRGRPAENGELGPNNMPYSDGRFSPAGAYRRHEDGAPKKHLGIDLPAPVGTPILAAANGIVEDRTSADGYGRIVVVQHDDGTRGIYAHLSKRLAHPGEKVRIGQQLGLVGVSGNAANRGSHLHFAIADNKAPIFTQAMKFLDPAKWIKRGTMP